MADVNQQGLPKNNQHLLEERFTWVCRELSLYQKSLSDMNIDEKSNFTSLASEFKHLSADNRLSHLVYDMQKKFMASDSLTQKVEAVTKIGSSQESGTKTETDAKIQAAQYFYVRQQQEAAAQRTEQIIQQNTQLTQAQQKEALKSFREWKEGKITPKKLTNKLLGMGAVSELESAEKAGLKVDWNKDVQNDSVKSVDAVHLLARKGYDFNIAHEDEKRGINLTISDTKLMDAQETQKETTELVQKMEDLSTQQDVLTQKSDTLSQQQIKEALNHYNMLKTMATSPEKLAAFEKDLPPEVRAAIEQQRLTDEKLNKKPILAIPVAGFAQQVIADAGKESIKKIEQEKQAAEKKAQECEKQIVECHNGVCTIVNKTQKDKEVCHAIRPHLNDKNKLTLDKATKIQSDTLSVAKKADIIIAQKKEKDTLKKTSSSQKESKKEPKKEVSQSSTHNGCSLKLSQSAQIVKIEEEEKNQPTPYQSSRVA